MTDDQMVPSHVDPFSNEICEIIKKQKNLKNRRNSTDICSILKPQSDLYHNSKLQNGVWVNGPSEKVRGNSADLLVFKRGYENRQPVFEPKEVEQNNKQNEDDEGILFYNPSNIEQFEHLSKQEEIKEQTTPKAEPEEITKELDSKPVEPKLSTSNNKAKNYNNNPFEAKPPKQSLKSKNLIDIEALLEYDGDDLDQIGKSISNRNSNDKLKRRSKDYGCNRR